MLNDLSLGGDSVPQNVPRSGDVAKPPFRITKRSNLHSELSSKVKLLKFNWIWRPEGTCIRHTHVLLFKYWFGHPGLLILPELEK